MFVLIQRSFHITDVTDEKLRSVLTEISGLDAYRSAAQVLAVVLEQCWDQALIRHRLGMIGKHLPKAEIVGANHFDAYDPEEASHQNIILSFMFFEHRAFAVDHIDLRSRTDIEAGIQLRSAISRYSPLKGVFLLVSHEKRDIEAILAEADRDCKDVPFFGSGSAALPTSSGDPLSFVFAGEELYCDTLTAVSFYGSELHLRVSCNYGWTPVGKTMTVTSTDGDFRVTGIDGKPAGEIYRKYLGLDHKKGQIQTFNICEFPLIIEKDGFISGRVPVDSTEEGALNFGAAVKNGSKIRFSYGAQHLILSETYNDSKEFGRFSPQGMFMIVCGNRLMFLKDDETKEIKYYRFICPRLAYTHGKSEIYRYGGKGGELHSAFIAAGIREGEKDRSYLQCAVPPYRKATEPNAVIPLEHRVMTFLHAVTKDLEDMTVRANSANEAKSTFLASMSHDIRTPINAILGMNEMILRECWDENITAYAENVRTAANTLLGLVNDILDFSKIEAGKLELIPVDYDLASLLNDLVNMVQLRAAAKGLELKLEIDSGTPKLLHGDEIRIKQIVTNILTNAVKYTEKGSVTFSAGFERIPGTDSQIMLKVSVQDTGIGIKEEDLPKLFGKFERIEETRNRNIEGTGLGMSITRKLLDMMNSKLEVKSVYGEGSVFSFGIVQDVTKWEPVGNYEEAFRRSLAERKKYREKFTAPSAHILVVDDTRMNLDVFVSLLKKTKVKTDTALSGAECLELSQSVKYDVIFLDHMMPDMDGIETLHRLKAPEDSPNAGTPVICLTANAVSGAKENYISAGFDGYLSKPIEPDELEALLIEYLPPEKVHFPDDAEESENTASVSSVIPEFIRSAEELDLNEGIRHCGSEELYIQTLATYAGAAADSTDEIERFLAAGDIGNAAIKIHALKSTSRVIGAMKLGDLAEKLEAAGNAGDIKTLGEGAGELIERCRKLADQLSPLVSGEETLPLISEDDLDEAYTLIREFLSVADFESAVGMIDELSRYSFPEKEKARSKALKKAAAEFDYDTISELLAEGV